jgi:hypothetical protein
MRLAGLLLGPAVVMMVGTLGRLMVLAAIVVIAAAGLCLLDGDEVSGIDLCGIAVAGTLALPLAVLLPVTGRALPALAGIRPFYAPDFPPPPPKA